MPNIINDTLSSKLMASQELRVLGMAQRNGQPYVPRARVSALFWILGIGVVIRLALWIAVQDQIPRIWDEKEYNTLAVNLVNHGEFAFTPGQPTSLRPPLYPFLLAGFYAVFGLENLQAVRLFQAGLSLGTVLLVYWLGKALYSRRVGLWAAAFTCLYPTVLGFNNLLLTETLFTFLLSAFCVLAVQSLRRDSLMLLAATGIVLGLGALTRSVLWLFPPVLGLFLLWAWPGNVGRRISAAVVVTLAFAATIAPWTARNTILQRTFVTIDVMGGRNFMMGNYRYTPLYRSWDAIALTGDKSWWHEVQAAYPPSERTTQGEIDKLAMRQALSFIKENPGLTLQRSLVKFFDFWGLERELVAGAARGIFGEAPKSGVVLLAVLIMGSYASAMFLGLFGAFAASPSDRRFRALLLLIIVFVCAMHCLAFGHSRYHLPLMPIVLLFAAAAVIQARSIVQERRCWSFRLASLGCVTLLAGWLWLFFAVDLDLFLGV